MNKQPSWPLTLYYDGDCPLCAREIQLLRQHTDVQRLCLVDISLRDFHAESIGLTQPALQNLLHARFADGQWVTGLDATLWSWRAAGLGRWTAPSPGLRCDRYWSWVIERFVAYAPTSNGYLIQTLADAARTHSAPQLKPRAKSAHTNPQAWILSNQRGPADDFIVTFRLQQ